MSVMKTPSGMTPPHSNRKNPKKNLKTQRCPRKENPSTRSNSQLSSTPMKKVSPIPERPSSTEEKEEKQTATPPRTSSPTSKDPTSNTLKMNLDKSMSTLLKLSETSRWKTEFQWTTTKLYTMNLDSKKPGRNSSGQRCSTVNWWSQEAPWRPEESTWRNSTCLKMLSSQRNSAR